MYDHSKAEMEDVYTMTNKAELKIIHVEGSTDVVTEEKALEIAKRIRAGALRSAAAKKLHEVFNTLNTTFHHK